MNTTAKERAEVLERLARLGISRQDACKLRRIALTLHRWHESECGNDSSCIERDEQTGIPYRLYSANMRRNRIRDLERGALKRLGALLAHYPDLTPYVQTDPRGASLYLLTRATLDLYKLPIDQCYSHGTAIY